MYMLARREVSNCTAVGPTNPYPAAKRSFHIVQVIANVSAPTIVILGVV